MIEHGVIEGYAFLASAIAGRRVSVHLLARGDTLAYTDGQIIVMPSANARDDGLRSDSVIEEGDSVGEGHDLSWLPVAAQAALIAAYSLEPSLLLQLIGRPDTIRRYVYLEVVRAAHATKGRLPMAFSRQPELVDMEPLSGSPSESLSLARSSRPLPKTPTYFGTVRPMAALQRAVGDRGLGAVMRNPRQGNSAREDVPELDEDEPSEHSAILRLLQNPFAGRDPFSDVLNQILGAGTSKAKTADDAGGAEMPVGRVERAWRRGVNAIVAKSPVDLPDLPSWMDARSLKYPEWDIYKRRYRPDWVFVEAVDPWRPDGVQHSPEMRRPASRELRRQLAGLGLDHEMHRRQSEGADLDMGALLECAIDLATGHTPADGNVYRASRRTRRDLAVVLVLDISGSTGEADAQGSSVFGKQLQLVRQLGTTFDHLGDRLAVFGFHSWGRKRVRVVRIKAQDERWSGQVDERLGLLEPVGYTRTGTAIRHGTRLLRESMRLPNRLLILMTDGIAYDQDYEHRYGEGDSRKALEEAKAAGIACVCLTVGAATETTKLAEVFGAANILAVDEVAQITRHVRRVCRQALASVSLRRFASRDAHALRGVPLS